MEMLEEFVFHFNTAGADKNTISPDLCDMLCGIVMEMKDHSRTWTRVLRQPTGLAHALMSALWLHLKAFSGM
jgi:hypothetical protein